MAPRPSRETARGETAPHPDKARELQEAIIEDAGETGDSDRDLVHGEGGTLGFPAEPEPGDLSKDD